MTTIIVGAVSFIFGVILSEKVNNHPKVIKFKTWLRTYVRDNVKP